MSRQELADLWRARLIDLGQSGTTAKAWCERNGFSVHQHYYWKRRLTPDTGEAQASGWLSLQVVGPHQAIQQNCITVKVAGTEIDLRAGFNVSLLRCVVQALVSEQC